MYYNIAIFSQFVVTPTGCIINAMDLKIFLNTNMLLKVECFEGFSIVRVDITVTITNLIITITNLTVS